MVTKALKLLFVFLVVALFTILWMSPASGADLSAGPQVGARQAPICPCSVGGMCLCPVNHCNCALAPEAPESDPQATRDARTAMALSAVKTTSTTTSTTTYADVYHASAKARRPFLLFVAGAPVRAVRGLAHAVVPHHNGKSHKHVVVAIPNASGDGFTGYELPSDASESLIVAMAFRETREPAIAPVARQIVGYRTICGPGGCRLTPIYR